MQPLGRRLIAVLMGSHLMLLLVAALTLAVLANAFLRQADEREAGVLADIISHGLISPLSFNDPLAAIELLDALRHDSRIRYAAVYDTAGERIADLGQAPTAATRYLPPPGVEGESVAAARQWRADGSMHLLRPIRIEWQSLGTLYLEFRNPNTLRLLGLQVGALTLLMALALAVLLPLAARMQRSIIAPVERLRETAREISDSGDYSLRVEVSADDELGTLAEAINEMLEQIELRDGELGSYNQRLAAEVADRTAELQRANAELQRLVAEARLATQAASDANRAKSEFMARISHEIRNPLSGMLGMSDLLLQADLPGKAHEHAQLLADAGRALLSDVNDLLDLFKIEAERLELRPAPMDLIALVDGVVATHRVAAEARGLELRWSPRAGLPRWVEGDAHRIGQILTNLLCNAVKFTASGHIELRLEAAAADGQHTLFGFEVEDTGRGIPPDQQRMIFDAYRQAAGSSSGTGLGLSICRELVERMGGDIGLESIPGHGSTFWFTLRLADASPPVADTAAPDRSGPDTRWRGRRVLVAEDNHINQELALSLLREFGCDAHGVGDGVAALEALGRGGYELVLMDCQMPLLDGLSATTRWRAAEPRQATPLPIIALTARAVPGDRERCLAAGMSDYLTKPYTRDDLARVLHRWLG